MKKLIFMFPILCCMAFCFVLSACHMQDSLESSKSSSTESSAARKNNTSEIVDKSVKDAKKAVLKYREMEVIHSPEDKEQMVSLIDIELLTGRHHQIRVQFAGVTGTCLALPT